MRTPIVVLLGAIMLGACSPGIIYVPATTPEPVTQPEPIEEAIPPVGVTVVREDGSRLLVSTNQPAYLAVFEIVPERGVALVYPVSPRQRQVAHTGATWLDVLADPARARSGVWMVDGGPGQSTASRNRATERYIYTVASYRPLRISSRAFDDGYLRNLLGPRAFRAADPYETMEALAQHFVPAQIDEDWGEDYLAMEIARPRSLARVARVYCPDGSITYVRDEYAERAMCPLRGRGTGVTARPGRPDSVVASGGGPVARRAGARPPASPPFRIHRPPVATQGQQNAGRPANGNPPASNPGRGSGSANGDERERSNNGNHYGWDNGNRGNGNGGNGAGNSNGNGAGSSTRNNAGNSNGHANNGNTGNGNAGNANASNGNASNAGGANAGSRGNGASNGAGTTSPIRSGIGRLPGRSGDTERDTSANVRQSGSSVTRRPVPGPVRRQMPDSSRAKPAAEQPAQPDSAQPSAEAKPEAAPAEAKPEPAPQEAKPRPTSRIPVTPRRAAPNAPDSATAAPGSSRGKRTTPP